jgi:pilus assembly protein Flp/PilA
MLDRIEEVNSMQTISQKLYARFLTIANDEEGQTMAEYGIVLALITLAVVGTLLLLGGAINDKFTEVLGNPTWSRGDGSPADRGSRHLRPATKGTRT